MSPKITYLSLLLYWLLPAGCSIENEPNNPAPHLSIAEAQNITRTSAELSGTISIPSGSLTHIYRFRYGTSVKMEQMAGSTLENGNAITLLRDLLPGTVYYYCLEAGNDKYMVQSQVLHFTTIPNEIPKIQEMVVLGQGPISIMVQCGISDNGGEKITAIGFSYAAEGKEEQEQVATLSEGNQWHLRIGELKENTNYTIKAFAENNIGRTYGDAYHFRTGQAVILTSAGTLPDIMDEKEKYGYTKLSIAGPLNGTDIRFIREMLGKDSQGNKTKGILSELDLTDARIVTGGLSYDGEHYTENSVIGYGMFGELEILKRLKLPESTKSIGQNALKNCIALATLLIPEETKELMPSDGCSSLYSIFAPSTNVMFSSNNGVLYDKKGEKLVWFPEGIIADELELSPTLKSLGDFALQRCRIRKIVLPNSITSLGKQVFYSSEVESVMLSDNIINIPYGLFQNCTNLTSVTFGSQSKQIGNYCFDGCSLKHLYIKASYPPVCEQNAFAGANNLLSVCTLYVPVESLNIYKNANTWKLFGKFGSLSDSTFH